MPSQRRIRDARRTVEDWLGTKGFRPFRFQRQVWNAYLDGESGLVHASTGTGKTLAAWLGPVIEFLAETEGQPPRRKTRKKHVEPLRVLWLTPLRALAADTEQTLRTTVEELGVDWVVERRTGDSSSAVRSRQQRRLPTALVTTPESATLLLARADAEERFRHLRLVVVDEWHELLGSKRGTQTELVLARLRRWRPGLRTWGLSATVGNLSEALDVLLGSRRVVTDGHGEITGEAQGRLVTGSSRKTYRIDSLIPETIDRFPWAGHLGTRLAPAVAAELHEGTTTLVFTNTRSQTELWYQALLAARPELAGQLALHHGSIGNETRTWVENGLKEGTLRCVVCTSSLDLGVDFHPVDRVFQVGSPKGIARLLQRAGRSGHRPGVTSRLTFVPTHALELVEIAAARAALLAGDVEDRMPLDHPLDVLVQHAVTVALGGGFIERELYEEVRTAWAFRDLTREAWEWVLDFVVRGGQALHAYPDYRRVTRADGVYTVDDRRVARRHRLSVGTITGDSGVTVQWLKGGRLGTIEEAFVSRLAPGDSFLFSGRTLTLVRVRDMTAYVRRAKGTVRKVPRWSGGRMPLSTNLAESLRRSLGDAADGTFDGPEMNAVRPILDLQERWSAIPRPGELLVESVKTREGHHTFLYPFAGRQVHEGLSALLAWRIGRRVPITFGLSVNDYGFELLSPTRPPIDDALADGLLSPENLDRDVLASMNSAEMARRQFREIARVSGLVQTATPGAGLSTRQLQASSGLLYDVFREYDPENLLLAQATREVLDRQLDRVRLAATLRRLSAATLVRRFPPRPSPLSFPLLVDRMRQHLSSEKLADRVRRMTLSLERAADR